MINKLYIDGKIVQLSESVTIPITYSIADFKNPEKRKRSSSKTISIPGTQDNKKIFASAYNMSLADFGNGLGFTIDPSKRITARYIKNGKEIFNGLARVLEVVIEDGNYTFEVVLFSDFVNIIKQLGDITVGELGWSEYDHNLNLHNITKSWDTSVKINGVDSINYAGVKPKGFGYWYPLIDYGYNTSLLTYNINDLVPYVYFKEIFKKAFGSFGYTIDSDFFNTDMFKALVFGFGGGKKEMLPPSDKLNRQVNYEFDGVVNKTLVSTGFDRAINLHNYSYDSIYELSQLSNVMLSDGYSQYNAASNKIHITKKGDYTLNLNYNIIVNIAQFTAGDTIRMAFEVYKNGTRINFTPPEYVNATSFNYSNNLDINLSLNAGDVVEVKLKLKVLTNISYTTPTPTYDIDVDFNNSMSFDLTSENGIYIENDLITLSRFIPNVKVSDFIKGVITMFNLYIDEADEQGVVKIEPINDFYYSNDKAENWTDILDHSKKVSIKSPSIISGKNYDFQWANEECYFKLDYLARNDIGYGNYIYKSDNEYNTKDVVYKLPFANVVPFETSGASNIVIPRIVNIDVLTNIVTPYKGKSKVMFNNGLKSGQFSINSNSGLNSYRSYPQAHHSFGDIRNLTFDLNFGKLIDTYYYFTHFQNSNLFQNYQRISIKELTNIDAKILKAYFKISDNIIGKNMFRKLVNINGVLYRKNLIINYDATENATTQVELYKVLETTEPDVLNPRLVSGIPSGSGVLIGSSPLSGTPVVLQGSPILSGGLNDTLSDKPLTVSNIIPQPI